MMLKLVAKKLRSSPPLIKALSLPASWSRAVTTSILTKSIFGNQIIKQWKNPRPSLHMESVEASNDATEQFDDEKSGQNPMEFVADVKASPI